jgi:hypothetical protein
LWQDDAVFVDCFSRSLIESPFAAYRWETPAIDESCLDRDFEYVLLDSPYLHAPADPHTYASYFQQDEQSRGVVVFDNLGSDATLVAPTPGGAEFAHVAEFMRCAPLQQVRTLWRVVAEAAVARLSDRPLWISTAGGGVYWLHVRLDSRPKYYGYLAYKPAGQAAIGVRS